MSLSMHYGGAPGLRTGDLIDPLARGVFPRGQVVAKLAAEGEGTVRAFLQSVSNEANL
jgi:hypothetical protein